MATTTNYGWDTPDDTDLVKDGAAAIRTLGSSIDTTTKNLNPQTTTGALAYRSATANVNTALPIGTANQVLRVNSGGTAPEWATTADQTPLTTKGDLFGFDTADARIPIGTNGHILTADSTQSLGLKWAAAAGGMTLLSTTTLTGSSVTISSINQSHINLYVQITGAQVSTGAGNLTLKINAVTDSFWAAGVDTDGSTGNTFVAAANAPMIIFKGTQTGSGAHLVSFELSNYTEATFHTIQGAFTSVNAGFRGGYYGGGWSPIAGGAAINDLVIATTAGSFNAGTVKIYGVK
jgi:hypothetical protein